ncbi:MAG: Transcription elongation factor GreA [Proteobacteria bacterium]|jgi:transcription elongation factor GreA|nr:MAG: Transcription elongation factor GreA [Pseudomonadota bacterium]
MERIYITVYGLEKLKTELEHMKQVERPNIIEAIAEARSHGDLSENAEYHSAKEKQSFIEGRIQELEAKISTASVVDPLKINETKVVFGATVEVVDVDTDEEKTYSIVGQDEADIDKNLISVSSPIARAFIGKYEGDEATVTTPGGKRTFEIEKIEYKEIKI